MIAVDDFADLITDVLDAADVSRRDDTGRRPSSRCITAAAFTWFRAPASRSA